MKGMVKLVVINDIDADQIRFLEVTDTLPAPGNPGTLCSPALSAGGQLLH
jgi:hypothetical protein